MKYFLYSFALLVATVPASVLAQWDKAAVNSKAELPDNTITQVVINVMNWLLALVGIVGIIGFVISGILYFIAAGDDSKMGTAKNAMTYSIIGVIVALMGYVIIKAADALLGGTVSNF
ncbi:MAG: hypothetical protein ACD_7C00030G0006 [uncultured bacterium]|nr:MAG: hypothetical protein ACD_7C00030G0006 [uncultured bacterium]HBR79022.1 hypothetical protein [Candidatus Moranbacteria bacterium]